MKNNPYGDLIRKYREEIAKPEHAAVLSDHDLEKVAGGVGGENEATCPVCGKPMKISNAGFGDSVWYCETCDMYQLLSDAEFVEMVKIMKQLGYPVELPVWWDQVK